MKYYSNIPEGFEELYKQILTEKIEGIEILKFGKDYVYYDTQVPVDEIKKLPFVEQTFLLVKYFERENAEFKKQIDWFSRNRGEVNETLKVLDKGERSYFRIVGSAKSISKKEVQDEVNRVENIVNIDRSHPDYDIRIIEKDDHGFIGVRFTETREQSSYVQSGSLRKEIAYLMLYLSQPDNEDIFLDPFCGGGIIPIMRSQMGEYKKIYCSDIDVKNVDSKLRELKIANLTVLNADFKEVGDMVGEKVNKIVTDPPWGFIQNVSDLKGLYASMLESFYNISEADSIFVILTPHLDIITEYITNNSSKYEVVDTYQGKVSGYLGNIIKIRRV